MPGKLPPETLLETVFSRTGAPDESVIQGPADGEDAAAISVGDETLVVSSDPISLAASHVGRLGVHIACNDVAVSGVDPRWLTAVVMLPDETLLDSVIADIDETATELGVAVVGGHTEYVDALDRPLVSLTAFGVGEFLPTGGAQPGDRLILTKGAAIEGTAILAADFGEELGVDKDLCDRAEQFLADISVIPDAAILRQYAHAMHDPTEGGIAAGLQELARASGVRLLVERERIPVRPETAALCEAADVDPLTIFGSGAVVASVPADAVEAAMAELSAADIPAAVIGTVETGDPELSVDGEGWNEPITDGLYPLWEESDE